MIQEDLRRAEEDIVMFSLIALLYMKVGNLLDRGYSWLRAEFFTPY